MNALSPDTRLAPEHLEELEKGSAIAPQTVRDAGLWSEGDPRMLARMTGRPSKLWTASHLPALVIPYWRPGDPDPGFNVKPRTEMRPSEKYIRPKGSRNRLYFPPRLRADSAFREDVNTPLVITEGEKKALCAESAGLACVAISGVDNWSKKRAAGGRRRELVDDFECLALKGRAVVICFDDDRVTNMAIRRAENDLAEALVRAGAQVKIARLGSRLSLPGGSLTDAKCGLDDFVVRHGYGALAQLVKEARPFKGETPASGWEAHLELDDSGGVRRTARNAALILSNGAWQGVITRDERADRLLFLKQPGWHEAGGALPGVRYAKLPHEIVRSDLFWITVWIEHEHGLSFSPDTILRAVEAVADSNRTDYVLQYLVELGTVVEPLIDQWLPRALGTADNSYTRAVGAKWLISAVARAFEPGCKADHVLLLEGRQGAGKSSALRVLGGPWFTDSLAPLGSKEAAMQLQGPWIVELSELDALRGAEASSAKAFLSRTVDEYRPPYGVGFVTRPRRCVFAGTTNEGGYLRDHTGGRRFWPVRCGRIDLDWLREHRDQLWAEAVARYRAGETWHLDEAEALALAGAEQEARYQGDEWEAVVRQWAEGREFVTLGEVLGEALHIERPRWGQIEQNRAARILIRMGRVRKQRRVGGVRTWGYAEPVPGEGEGGDEGGDEKPPVTSVTSPVSPLSPLVNRIWGDLRERGVIGETRIGLPGVKGRGGDSGASGDTEESGNRVTTESDRNDSDFPNRF